MPKASFQTVRPSAFTASLSQIRRIAATTPLLPQSSPLSNQIFCSFFAFVSTLFYYYYIHHIGHALAVYIVGSRITGSKDNQIVLLYFSFFLQDFREFLIILVEDSSIIPL